jgi:hypothetical protein
MYYIPYVEEKGGITGSIIRSKVKNLAVNKEEPYVHSLRLNGFMKSCLSIIIFDWASSFLTFFFIQILKIGDSDIYTHRKVIQSNYLIMENSLL